MKIKLNKAIKAGEKTYEELELDINQLTVRDYMNAAAKVNRGTSAAESLKMAEFDTGLHLALGIICAVRCNSGLDAVDIESQLSGRDINKIMMVGRSFFFGSEE